MEEEPTITCSECGTELHDPPERCSKCGSTARTYTITVKPGEIKLAGGETHLHVWSKATGHAISERAVRSLDELATGTAARTITWHDANEHGDVLCEVRDESGNVLGVNVGPDLDDAILNLAEDLKPPVE